MTDSAKNEGKERKAPRTVREDGDIHRVKAAPAGDRPQAGSSRARTRPKSRADLGSEHRDIIHVLGGDPEYVYRWVHDQSANGRTIYERTQLGYEMVDAQKEDLKIGDHQTGRDNMTHGSLYTQPADSEGGMLFLMRIHKDWYQEDLATKAEEVDQTERDILRERDPETDPDGQYGKNRLRAQLAQVARRPQ